MSGWTINSVIGQNINISKYKTLSGSSYINFPRELHNSRKALVNIQNSDNNECLKWFLVRHLSSVDHHPARIRKTENNFARYS